MSDNTRQQIDELIEALKKDFKHEVEKAVREELSKQQTNIINDVVEQAVAKVVEQAVAKSQLYNTTSEKSTETPLNQPNDNTAKSSSDQTSPNNENSWKNSMIETMIKELSVTDENTITVLQIVDTRLHMRKSTKPYETVLNAICKREQRKPNQDEQEFVKQIRRWINGAEKGNLCDSFPILKQNDK